MRETMSHVRFAHQRMIPAFVFAAAAPKDSFGIIK